MKRFAVCVFAVAVLLGHAKSAKAVQPKPWPAFYTLSVRDLANNQVDAGVVVFNRIPPGEILGSCYLAWTSDGVWRQALWQNFEVGPTNSVVLVVDTTASPLWFYMVAIYDAVLDEMPAGGTEGIILRSSNRVLYRVVPNLAPVAVPGGPYSGTALTPVAFNGLASFDPDGTIVAYAWDFGDGGTDTVATPNHSYAVAGTYTVTLTVTDNDGATGTSTTTATIQTAPPVADSGGPYSGTAGVAVPFDGSASSDPDGTIAVYAWDFGDGSTGNGTTPSHTYTAANTYTVTLTVTDNQGATGSATTIATISP